MVRRHIAAMALLWAVLPLGCGCAGPLFHRHAVRSPEPRTTGVYSQGGATVLKGPALTGGDGTLLSVMKGKIPGFLVHTGPDICPEIGLRGPASFGAWLNPTIYVDGTRATNTCVLQMLAARDVERVEVYPMGATRPGYLSNGRGLILIFLRWS